MGRRIEQGGVVNFQQQLDFQSLQMQYEQLYQENRLSAQSLRNCGFEEAPASSLPYQLYRAELSQQASCLRDTLMVALQNYQKLQNILLQAGTAKRWRFLHIVLCTMPDRVSRVKHKQAIEEIIRLNSMWQVASFRTCFLPISMRDQDIEEIMRFCEFGGPDWVSYPTTYDDFHQQFKAVVSEVGLGDKMSLLGSESHEENVFGVNPFENCSVAMTLSVEASEMMQGPKWEAIVNTLCFYLRNLSRRDVMSGIIFSSQPWVVGALAPEQPPQLAQQEALPRPAPPRNARPAQPQPQYAAYAAQPVAPRQGNGGRNCGYCCGVLFILFIIRLIIVLAASS